MLLRMWTSPPLFYRTSDKVIHLVNDAEVNVFNGDLGYITDLIPGKYTESKQDEIVIDFDGNEISYPRNEWYKIRLAYAMSIHKSQGSEFPVVILPITSASKRMLERNLIYTAITRAKSKLILLGELFRQIVQTWRENQAPRKRPWNHTWIQSHVTKSLPEKCKESVEPAKDTTTEALRSTLPVLENANNNTVVTKTLVLPTDENGVQQIQTITYKGKQFLTLTIQQKRQVSEELKNYIAEHGLEEAKTALKEEEDKDESVQAARKIPGFSLETTLLSETEIETKTSYDFQVLDVKKASESEYLKNVGLENLLKNEPEEYIASRVASGATVQ